MLFSVSVSDMTASELGRKLGKLGAGKRKTMSMAAIRQRKRAARFPRKRKTCQVFGNGENKSE